MQHAAAVGIGDGVADILEAAKEFAESERSLAGIAVRAFGLVKALDGVLQVVTADETHGIERSAIGVLA
jgi:hypothetical protein